MTRPATGLVAILAAALVVGGCGGEDEPELYRLGATKACLEQANIPVRTRNLDFVAANALGGGLHAKFAGNHVTLAFGASEEGARAIERAYRRFAGKTIVVEEVLMREGNVVMVWGGGPSQAQLSAITGCLDS